MSDDQTKSPELRMDVDSGLRFLHVMGMRSKADIIEANSRILALVEELVAAGQLDMRSFDQRRERIRTREQSRPDDTLVQMTPHVDKYALKDTPKIDCEARYPLCQGRCCKLAFPLTRQDLDERVLQWEYSRPYMIRKREDQRCVHQTASFTCGVYEQRPAICRSYDCRNDKRIWLDFDKREIAPDLADRASPPNMSGTGK